MSNNAKRILLDVYGEHSRPIVTRIYIVERGTDYGAIE